MNIYDLDAPKAGSSTNGSPITFEMWKQSSDGPFPEFKYLSDILPQINWCNPSIWSYTPDQQNYPQFEITTGIMPQPTLNFPLQTAAFKPAVKPQAVTPSNSILYRLTSASALNGVTSFFFSPSFENYSTVLKFYAMSVFYYKDLDSYNGKIHLVSWNGSMFSEKPVIVNSNQPVFLCPVVEGKLKNGSDVYLTPTAVANKLFAEIFKYNETNPASSSYQTVPVVDFTNYDNFPVDTWVFYVHQIRGERNGNSMPTWYDAVSEDTADQNRGYAAVAPVRITKDQSFCFSFSKEEGSYWFAASTSNTTMGSRLECRTAGYQAYRASVQRFKRISFKRNVSGENSVAVWASAFINVPYWLNHSHLTVNFGDSTIPLWENAFYGVDCSGLWWAANRAAGNSSYPLRRAREYHNSMSIRTFQYDPDYPLNLTDYNQYEGTLDPGEEISTDNDLDNDGIEDVSYGSIIQNWRIKFRHYFGAIVQSGDAWFIDVTSTTSNHIDHMGIYSIVPVGPNATGSLIHASAGAQRRVVRVMDPKRSSWCNGFSGRYICKGVGR